MNDVLTATAATAQSLQRDVSVSGPTTATCEAWVGNQKVQGRYTRRIAEMRNTLRTKHPTIERIIKHNPFEATEYYQTPTELVGPYTPPSVNLGNVTRDERQAYWAEAVLWQMERFDDRFDRVGVPDAFYEHFLESFHRILEQLEDDLDWITDNPDVFAKDLAITRMWLFPAGARLIHPFVGISRKAVIRAGISAMNYVFRRCGGSAPFFGWHTHAPMTKQHFNARGFETTCELTAQLVACDSRARGVLGASWFHDPKLEEISPHLSFLRSPVSEGACLVELGPSEETTRLASLKSASRRRLIEQGSYVPKTYALIWSRGDILKRYG